MKYDTRLDTRKFVSLYTLYLRLQQMDIEPIVWNTTYYLKCSIFWNITPCSPLKAELAICSLVSCSAYSTLKVKATCSSETSVDFQLHNHRCENQKSDLLFNETLPSHAILPNHLTLKSTVVIVCMRNIPTEAVEIK
jgi:hypothetical protein